MKSSIEKLPKSTYKINVEIPKEKIERVKNNVLQKLAQKTKITGFREGKAPIDLVEKNIDKNLLNREVLNELLSDVYAGLIKEHHLKPIANPKFDLKEWEPFENLKFNITVAEKPEIKIGDYNKILKDKTPTIITKESQNKEKITSDDVINALLEVTEAEIPDILIEEEVNRMLSNLLDQVTRLGLTIEKYLQSKNRTSEQLREEFTKKAQESLKAEFALTELIKKENIEVSEKEIEEAVNANPDEKARKELAKEDNKWYIKTVISRQKLIQKIIDQLEKPDPKGGSNEGT